MYSVRPNVQCCAKCTVIQQEGDILCAMNVDSASWSWWQLRVKSTVPQPSAEWPLLAPDSRYGWWGWVVVDGGGWGSGFIPQIDL